MVIRVNVREIWNSIREMSANFVLSSIYDPDYPE